MSADIITTLGTGVNGSVRRLGYTFNTQGMPELSTSYSDTSGTTVVNQVKDEYNGLGQMVSVPPTPSSILSPNQSISGHRKQGDKR